MMHNHNYNLGNGVHIGLNDTTVNIPNTINQSNTVNTKKESLEFSMYVRQTYKPITGETKSHYGEQLYQINPENELKINFI